MNENHYKQLVSKLVFDGKVVGFEVEVGDTSVLLVGKDFVTEFTDQSDLPSELVDIEPPRVVPMNDISSFEAAWREFSSLSDKKLPKDLMLNDAKDFEKNFSLDKPLRMSRDE